MKKIFIGFILIFLDFNLNLGNSVVGLIPDFIGYIVMVNGLVEMGSESMLFMNMKPYAVGMAVYTGILYALDLLGVTVSLGTLSYVLALTSVAVSLYISYNIVMGVKDMEKKYYVLLDGIKLKSTWTLLAVFNVLNFVMLLVPLAGLVTVSILASLIISIYFLVVFNNSKKLYYNTLDKHFR